MTVNPKILYYPVQDAKQKVLDALDKHSRPLGLADYIDLMKSIMDDIEIRLDDAKIDLKRQNGTD